MVDPITELAALANQMHELYRAYVDAGFTEAEALELIKHQITIAATNPPTSDT
ncbi:hypothetical protein L5I01_17370 [Gordonia sp. HY442]|uniref:hypothetical protein n=1 Tax=Gordonia zhenghanii TaxID=2911516 RepID=UPI001F21C93C|nr:hypothetical protein [Gordonia zhenghanii]MCF8605127.1 hypothetical protein [Gordonia zhenghanii]